MKDQNARRPRLSLAALASHVVARRDALVDGLEVWAVKLDEPVTAYVSISVEPKRYQWVILLIEAGQEIGCFHTMSKDMALMVYRDCERLLDPKYGAPGRGATEDFSS